MERVFGTCQSQFEAEVRAGDILPLEELNRTFSAYLEIAYHQRIHSETHQIPKERYGEGLTVIRHVDMEEVIHFFMKQDKRTVDKDFSDIRLNNRFYRVDPRLRGDKVQLRYDPFSDMEKVWIYSLHDEYLGQGSLYQRDQGAEPERVWQKTKPKHNYLELLKQEHDRQLQAQSKGIDYRKVISQRAWPFAAFTQKLAKLMGRKGGLGAFNGEEYEMLKKAYNRMPEVNEPILVEPWEKAAQKTIPHLLYQLQIIKDRKENR